MFLKNWLRFKFTFKFIICLKSRIVSWVNRYISTSTVFSLLCAHLHWFTVGLFVCVIPFDISSSTSDNTEAPSLHSPLSDGVLTVTEPEILRRAQILLQQEALQRPVWPRHLHLRTQAAEGSDLQAGAQTRTQNHVRSERGRAVQEVNVVKLERTDRNRSQMFGSLADWSLIQRSRCWTLWWRHTHLNLRPRPQAAAAFLSRLIG